MSADATADAFTGKRGLSNKILDDTDSDAGQDGPVDVGVTAAPSEAAPEAFAARRPVAPAAGQVVPRVEVQNKQLKGTLMLDQYPWMIELPDGRKISPSEYERQAGSLRKNWKSSTYVIQPDGRVGMNVGNWLDTMGIHNPAKAKGSAQPSKAAKPAQANAAKQTAVADSKAGRVRRAANPEKHLAELRALLASHGKKLGEGWKVEYTEVKRNGGECIDWDPYYIAPEGFVPDMAELPAGFVGRSYNSRTKVARAHGVRASAAGQRTATAKAPNSSARAGARAGMVRKSPPVTGGTTNNDSGSEGSGNNDDEDYEAEETHEPPAKRTRNAAAAQAARAGKAPASSGPLSPSTQTQKAGAQALLQLKAVDQTAPRAAPQPAPAAAAADGAGNSSQQAVDLFTRVQTFISIVELDADSLKRKHIRRYMQQAKAALEELFEMWTGSVDSEVN